MAIESRSNSQKFDQMAVIIGEALSQRVHYSSMLEKSR